MIDLKDMSNLILLLLLYYLSWILDLNYVFFTWLTKEKLSMSNFCYYLSFSKKKYISEWFSDYSNRSHNRSQNRHRIDHKIGHRIGHKFSHKIDHRFDHKISHKIGHRIDHYTSVTSKIANDAFGHCFNQWLILVI